MGHPISLHELAESPLLEITPGSNDPPSDDGSLHRNGIGTSDTTSPNKGDKHILEDAFSSNGLPQLPTQETRPAQSAEALGFGERRNCSRNKVTVPTFEIDQEDEPEVKNTEKPSEISLLHDLPFTLQGLSSNHLPFSSRSTLDLPPTLPLPVISLLHTLAEPSLLYRVLSDFVDSRDEGLVGQSLRSAIGMELRSYLGLIATLEGEIRRAIAAVNPNEPRGGIGKAGVTLKRCVVWTREATMGLRLMSLMAEEAKSTYNEAHQFHSLKLSRQEGRSTDHDDPFFLNISRRSFRCSIRGKDARTHDAAVLRHAASMDIRWRALGSVS